MLMLLHNSFLPLWFQLKNSTLGLHFNKISAIWAFQEEISLKQVERQQPEPWFCHPC